eukprot:5104262-Pleurochrysis_carterae.AAC.2
MRRRALSRCAANGARAHLNADFLQAIAQPTRATQALSAGSSRSQLREHALQEQRARYQAACAGHSVRATGVGAAHPRRHGILTQGRSWGAGATRSRTTWPSRAERWRAASASPLPPGRAHGRRARASAHDTQHSMARTVLNGTN